MGGIIYDTEQFSNDRPLCNRQEDQRSERAERNHRKALQAFLGFNEPVSIYKWQRGECLPTFDNMYAMACLFGVGIDDLLVGNRQEWLFCLRAMGAL